MKRKVIQNILLGLLILTIGGTAIGYYLYNKGPVDVQNSDALTVKAGELYEHFINDSALAQTRYTNKIITVSGVVHDISINQQQKQIILLLTNTGAAYINCTMEENAPEIKVKATIRIKGICSGIGEGDADLGINGDVYLTRCYLQK